MIKIIALDIYGTVLATDDPDNELPPRRGLESFFQDCKNKKIKIVSASDNDITNTRIDLEESGVDPSHFDKFYQLDQYPHKDFSQLLKDYDITAAELLVIGDSDKDIGGAVKIKANYLRVPEYYKHLDDFDFSLVQP